MGLTVLIININLAIAGLCWYGVWRVLKIRRALAIAVRGLDIAERSTHNVLYGAPQAIMKGQLGIYRLRQRYQGLELQLQRLQMVLSLLSFGQMAWSRISPTRRQRRSKWVKKSMMVSREQL